MRSRRMAGLLFWSTVVFSPVLAHAQAAQLGPLTIDQAWSRPTAPGQRTGAGYMVLRNTGDQPDRLLGASTPVAQTVEMHSQTIDSEGVARMREIQSIEIPAGGETALQPSGLHLMLVGLKQPITQGQSVPVTLRFEHAGTVEIEFAAQRSAPAAGEHHH